MKVFKVYGTDEDKEKDGVWFDLGDDCSVKVAAISANNMGFSKAFEKEYSKYQHAISNNTLPAKKYNQIINSLLANHVVKDWKGFQDNDGNEIPFSKENVVNVLNQLPNLASDIQEFARNRKIYQPEDLEAVEKN